MCAPLPFTEHMCALQILASIGEDLLVASADKPFRFPAEFTFVVRSFTVLDGIGKSLSPRFDISEISAPYARELILDGKSAVSQLQDRLGKRFERQNRAVKGLFEGPLTIQDINASLRRCAATFRRTAGVVALGVLIVTYHFQQLLGHMQVYPSMFQAMHPLLLQRSSVMYVQH